MTIDLMLTRFLCKEAKWKLRTNLKLYLRRQKGLKLTIFVHNSEEVIESVEYGQAVFDAEVITQKQIICLLSNPLHWTCVHRKYSWRLGWSTSLQWGSTLTIETFVIFKQYLCFIWILGLSEVLAFFKFILPRSTQVPHYKCIFVQYISTWIYLF